MPSLRYNRDEVELSAAESALQDLDSRVSSAKSTIQGMYRTLMDNVRQTVDQVKEIGFLPRAPAPLHFTLCSSHAAAGPLRVYLVF